MLTLLWEGNLENFIFNNIFYLNIVEEQAGECHEEDVTGKWDLAAFVHQNFGNLAQVNGQQAECLLVEAVQRQPKGGRGHQKERQFAPLPVGHWADVPVLLLDLRVETGQQQVGQGKTGKRGLIQKIIVKNETNLSSHHPSLPNSPGSTISRPAVSLRKKRATRGSRYRPPAIVQNLSRTANSNTLNGIDMMVKQSRKKRKFFAN